MVRCNCCLGTDFNPVVNLGPIPIAHRFQSENNPQGEFKHELSVHICNTCGLLQILNPIDPEVLYKDYNFCFTSWKTQPQTTPEIALIKNCVGSDGLVVEVGSNDGSFLNEMKNSGLKSIVGVEPNLAACQVARQTGVHVIEGFFDNIVAKQIRSTHGEVGLVVSRQVVEHIKDLQSLMTNIKEILKPEGWILFEVPDFEVPLRHGDVSSLWEEHISYFTEATLTAFVSRYGFKVSKVDRYPTNGGALMVLAQRTESPQALEKFSAGIQEIKNLAKSYDAKVNEFSKHLRTRLQRNHQEGRLNVLYGTGCRANTLINGLGLQAEFDILVDDQSEKQGLYMPGCGKKIEPSLVINNARTTCFLSVNYENEERVIAKHSNYLKNGGEFYSVNCPSPLFNRILQ